jgi:hypothetical protein
MASSDCVPIRPSKIDSSLVAQPPQTPSLSKATVRVWRRFVRVSDGTRTRDRLDHNQELYRLSYAHRDVRNVAVDLAAAARARGAVSRGG